MTHKPEPGTRVRMTRTFLRNTGQFTGTDAHAVWTVQACECGLCKVGPYILTDQPLTNAHDDIAFRHINFCNLEKARD